FLNASLRGWKDALTNREEAVDAVMTANPTLDRQQQAEMLDEVAKLILEGSRPNELGYIDQDKLEYTQEFMLENEVITAPIDLDKAVDYSFYENVPEEFRKI